MKSVYNGYEEYFLTGRELKELFDIYFLMTKHKKTCVLDMTISEYLKFMGIENDKIYRIFENGYYCRLADDETDNEISFFGFVPEGAFDQYEDYAPNDKMCRKCGAHLKIRISRYGEFLGCSNYPKGKYKKTLYVIGNEKF